MRADLKIISCLAALLISAFSCSRDIKEPISPPIHDAVPPTPGGFSITVGDRMAFLSWTISDTQNIKFYRVYLSDNRPDSFRVISEATQTSYTAVNLQNGLTYYFKVSAVNSSNFEGYGSLVVTAVPNLYGIIINGSARYSNNRNVGLTLVAPAETRYMQVSNDSTFAGDLWENYSVSKSWELTAGDESKSVFVKYRNQNDQITSAYYSASITLDTQAAIDSIVFTPIEQALVTGDRIHFKLFAREPEGTSRATVGQGIIDINLYDDGTRGDIVAGDGVYESDFIIASNLDFSNANVVGNFTDRADNVAQQVQARSYISVQRAPDAVPIFGIIAPNGFFDRLQIDWNASQAPDFAQYRVYRAQTANVDSSDYLVRVISDISATTLVDTGLTQSTVYYYKVYVVDNSGLWAGSNEVHAGTNSHLPPEAVVLYPAVALPGTHDRLNLSWSASHDQDFLRYQLFRSYDISVTASDILILASATETSAVDSNLAADSTYYYRVMVLDRAGNSSWSNTINGRTGQDSPPSPSILYPIEIAPDNYLSIRVDWSQPYLPDFQSYKVYSWKTDSGRPDSSLAATILNQDSTALVFQPVFDGNSDTLNYWFVVHTTDLGGHHSASNALRVHLADFVPGFVTGTVVADSASLTIYWNATEIPDFGNYRLLRDTLSTPGQSVPVFMSTDRSTSSFTDRNLVRGHTYYYWLDIYDMRGHSSRSALGSRRW